MSIGQEIVRFGRELIGRNAAIEPVAEVAHREQWLQRMGTPSFQAFVDSFLTFQGQIYQPGYTTTYAGEKVEPVTDNFLGYVSGAYKSNGIIFAVSMARARPFSEISFKFRRRRQSGGGNDLFGLPELDILDTPWPGGTTQDLLMRAEQDITCGGTAFWVRESGRDGDRLRRLRPDWCEFILTAPPDQAIQSDVVGIKYTAGGPWGGGPSELYPTRGRFAEAAFWAPIPDPDALYRGMSWLTPVIQEMQADKAASSHKLKFFENAATPNLSVSLKESVGPDKFVDFVRKMNEASVGVENAYKTLYTGGGADVRVIGADMQQLDFRATQGAGETRIAAAGGVPPIVVGLSEGLAAATYSNYGQAKRAYGDLFLRSQWRSFCGAISPIIDVPADATLWYDAADVAFLREDSKDLADIQAVQASTINTLISAGYTPESVVSAVLAEDFSKLKHSGMMSVQLQPPGKPEGDKPAEPAADPVAETATKAGTITGLLGTEAFDPESIVTAVEADDLTQLEIVEPLAEPGAAPGEEVAADVPPEDDAALADGIDSLQVARGRHDYVRDSEGQFARTPGAKIGPIADPLKLGGRIKLGPGEQFSGSARVHDRDGDASAVMARIDTGDGPRIRFGLVHPEDVRSWGAQDRGGTVELTPQSAEELRHVIKDAEQAGKANVAAFRASLRDARKSGVPEDQWPHSEDDIAQGSITGSRWGDLDWKLTREEGPDYADYGPGGKWSLGLSVNDGEPFYLESSAQVGKLDKALANLMGDGA